MATEQSLQEPTFEDFDEYISHMLDQPNFDIEAVNKEITAEIQNHEETKLYITEAISEISRKLIANDILKDHKVNLASCQLQSSNVFHVNTVYHNLCRQLDQVSKFIEHSTEVNTIADILNKFNSRIQSIKETGIRDLIRIYLESQNDFGYLQDHLESVLSDKEFSDLQLTEIFAQKLAVIFEQMKDRIESEFLQDERKFLQLVTECEGSMSLIESLSSHYYIRLLEETWPKSEISRIRYTKTCLETIYQGVLYDKIDRLSREFIKKQADQLTQNYKSRIVGQAELDNFAQKLKALNYESMGEDLKLQILTESNINNLNKLAAVKNVLLEFFNEQAMTFDEFYEYLSLNTPTTTNVFELLKLDNTIENRPLANSYIENYYALIYNILGYFMDDESRWTVDALLGLESVLVLLYNGVMTLDSHPKFEELMESQAFLEVRFYDRTVKLESYTG